MYKILLVDDSVDYATKLSDFLREEGYLVTVVNDPITGIEQFAKSSYDLVISDFRMDHMDGVRFLSTVKSINPEIKCILLTGFLTEDTELRALDHYVDKYMEKEKSLVILLKHIEQTLSEKNEKGEGNSTLVSSVENIMVDLKAHKVYMDNQEITLTRKEFELLQLFLENKGVAFTREEIVEKLWTSEIEMLDPRAVDKHIQRLREKINCFSIISIRGYGYKWNE